MQFSLTLLPDPGKSCFNFSFEVVSCLLTIGCDDMTKKNRKTSRFFAQQLPFKLKGEVLLLLEKKRTAQNLRASKTCPLARFA
jgi:hypothetical protein